MAIELRRDRAAAMAQHLHIGDHELVADGSVAEGGTDAGFKLATTGQRRRWAGLVAKPTLFRCPSESSLRVEP